MGKDYSELLLATEPDPSLTQTKNKKRKTKGKFIISYNVKDLGVDRPSADSVDSNNITEIFLLYCVCGLASSFFFRESFSTQGQDGYQLLQKYFLPSCQAATLPKSHCCGCSVIKSCLTLCDPGTAALQAFLSFAISWSFIKVMSTELVMPSNHLIPCHPLLLLPSVFPSIRVYSNESALRVRWPKYCNHSIGLSMNTQG